MPLWAEWELRMDCIVFRDILACSHGHRAKRSELAQKGGSQRVGLGVMGSGNTSATCYRNAGELMGQQYQKLALEPAWRWYWEDKDTISAPLQVGAWG